MMQNQEKFITLKNITHQMVNKMKNIMLILLLVSCSQRLPVHEYSTHTEINEHYGGQVIKEYGKILNYKTPIEVRGFCASACTLVYERKNTCVHPNSVSCFHSPFDKEGRINNFIFYYMADSYPQLLKQWFIKHCYDNRRDYCFNGYEMNQQFNIPICK